MSYQKLTISNPQITLKRDRNGKTYFLILDQDTNLVYFGFPNFIKKGEHELITKWFQVQAIWIKFESQWKRNKVIEFKVLK